MPIVHIDILERTVEAKRKLVAAVTDAVVDSLGVSPESVTIVINDMKADHYAVAGVLHTDKK